MSLNKPASNHSMLSLIFPPAQAEGVKEEVDPKDAWHFYSHVIQRNPTDLKSQTRRIFFAMQYDDAKFLSGALYDLFVTLKGAGRQLRIRLLKASAPYLDKKEIIRFVAWIKSENEQDHDFCWISGSMLSVGLTESNKQLMTQHKEEVLKEKLSPIEEARSCMEYGQLDLAKKILEDALGLDKSNVALQDELKNLLAYMDPDDREQVDKAIGE